MLMKCTGDFSSERCMYVQFYASCGHHLIYHHSELSHKHHSAETSINYQGSSRIVLVPFSIDPPENTA